MGKKINSLRETNISNDWLFGKTMSDAELCRMLLEKVLDVKIKKVEFLNNQQVVDNLNGVKGIRLDIYVESDESAVYDIEMQTKNKEVVNRSRFYQSSLDMDMIGKGDPYEQLSPSYIIFICTFDLFKLGRYQYSFKYWCDEDKELQLGDGTHKVFLNTQGTIDDVDEDIKEFLAYVENSNEEVAKNCKSDLVKKVREKVEAIRSDEECEVEFMTYLDRLNEEREEGRIEGRVEGREQGKVELAEEMIKKNLGVDLIMQITKFTEQQIKEIEKNMKISV
ncbi:MAG: Rpn family recombination-promoting nuclease/putative transposase [Lachnospiraceae bacterium]